MARVIVEIDGERHRLTKDRKLDFDCEDCSLVEKCNKLEAICSIFKSEGGSYHFVKEE